jgi:outer membrane protein insertion porin family
MFDHFPRRLFPWLLLLLLGVAGVVQPAAAAPTTPAAPASTPAAPAPERVLSVGVTGNRFIETETVLADVKTKAGDVLDRKQIGRDVRTLFDTGYFSDVSVEGIRSPQGVRVIFHVVENPVIGEVKIKGNDAIETKIFKFKLKMVPGRVLNAALERHDIHTIRSMYLKKGYYQVGIHIKTTKRSDGRVDVVINIVEGQVTHIVRILFVGNHAFSDAELRDQLGSQQSGFMAWFSGRNVFHKDRLGSDARLLLQFYQNKGYLDSKVESTLVSLSADKKSFYLTFNVYEGPKYSISKVDLSGDMVPSRKVLESALAMKAGQTYSLDNLRKSIQAVTEKVGDEGYAFATVTPLFHRNLSDNTVAITLDVEKGREVYVERIEITGNEKTEDHVIRRELRQGEAARYSASKVNRSKVRLNRLGYFNDVKVTTPRAGSDNRVNMNLDVQEKKTGSFSIGAGYSQLQKMIFTTKFQENNFLGKGYTTNINADIGKITQNFSVGMTDPYFLGKNISAAINAFKTETNLTLISSSYLPYNYNNVGAGVNFGVPLSEYLSYGIGYQYSSNNIFNVQPNSSILIQAERGVTTIGEVSQTLTWDSRDNILVPHKGQYYQLMAGYAGLGGNQRFYDASLASKVYLPLSENVTLEPSIQGDYIHGVNGRQIPLWRRYSLGGLGSLRGFNYYGVTLRDPTTGDVLGGEKMAVVALDLFFPLPYMQTRGFRGDIFYNAGTVWGKADTTAGTRTLHVAEPFSMNRVRSAAGFELQWLSPMGPLALIWGFPLRSLPGDRTQSFQFALGSQF